MKPTRTSEVLAAACTLALASTPLAAQDTFLVDFGGGTQTFMGPAPDDPDNIWNNLDGGVGQSDAGILFDLQTTTGDIVIDMNIEMVRRFNGVNNSGTNLSLIYPENATVDNLFGNTEEFSGLSDVFPAFKLTGLDPALAYTFTFYASRLGVGDVRETGYTVTGSTSAFAALDAANNDFDETAVVASITPDANNEILIEIAPTAANTNGNHFTYLGVLKVVTGEPIVDVTITAQPVSQFVTEFFPVTFAVSAAGSGDLSYQWFLGGDPIEGATGASYTIDEATLAMDGSVFTVEVTNGITTATSDGATLTVDPDFEFPTFDFTYSPGGNTAFAFFSKQVTEPTATDPSNYSFTQDGSPIGITAVTLDPDQTKVTFDLAAPLTGEYVIVANNVEDRSGNAIDFDATLIGQVPDPDPTRILIDFGGEPTTMGDFPDDPLYQWNHVSNAVGADDFGFVDGFVTTTGDFTTIGVEMIARFNGTNASGTRMSDRYPPSASGDSLYGNVEEWGGLVDILPEFNLIGLDPDKSYDLRFYASRLGAGDNRETSYTVTGATEESAVLDPADNQFGAVTVEALQPAADGSVHVAMAPTDNNNNGNHFIYLGVLELRESGGEPPAGAPIEVTSIELDAFTGDLTLMWTSVAGTTYEIQWWNPDATAWQSAVDSIAGQAGTTTGTVSGVDPLAPPRYGLYRVAEEP